MLIWRNYFHENRFLSFLYAPLHYSYDVAYRSNEFYRSLALNFFRKLFYFSDVWDRFSVFLLSEVDVDLTSLLIAVL